MELYLKAADKGVIYAMGNIGILYQKGLGVKRDYAKAAEWYKKSSDKGSIKVFILFNSI